MLSFRVKPRVTGSNVEDSGNRSAGLGADGNEGVGEHVRTRFHLGLKPDETADQRSAPNEENLFLLPDRISRSKLLERTIQPFDLMSRRHPLSSTRAAGVEIRFEKRTVSGLL
jgi:hypothetical protein